MKNEIVLVTGASGFVGAAVCDALVGLQHVRAAVRATYSEKLPLGVEKVHGELARDFDWTPQLHGVSTIVHCAARVHVIKERAGEPVKAFRDVNVDGTLSLARQAASCGVGRFIFLSSVGVNGATTNGVPFSPDDKPAPHSAYATSKLEAEIGLGAIARETGMELVIIRPPMVYGPDAPGNFRGLVRGLRTGIPLPLKWVTQNRRSFIYIGNLVSFIRLCIDHPAATNHIFLVRDSEELSTAGLLRRMGSAFKVSVRLVPFPAALLRIAAFLMGRPGIYHSLCGSLQMDISKAENLLGWKPPFSIDEGLARTAQGRSK